MTESAHRPSTFGVMMTRQLFGEFTQACGLETQRQEQRISHNELLRQALRAHFLLQPAGRQWVYEQYGVEEAGELVGVTFRLNPKIIETMSLFAMVDGMSDEKLSLCALKHRLWHIQRQLL